MVTGINVLSHIIDGFTHVDPSLLYYFGLIMHFGKIQLRSCRQVQQVCTPAVKVPEAVARMDDRVQGIFVSGVMNVLQDLAELALEFCKIVTSQICGLEQVDRVVRNQLED